LALVAKLLLKMVDIKSALKSYAKPG